MAKRDVGLESFRQRRQRGDDKDTAQRIVPIIALVAVAAAGSAVLLEEFGTLETAETEIKQSVYVDGAALDSESPPVKLFNSRGERKELRAGSSASGTVNITNKAQAIVPIEMVTANDDNYLYNSSNVRYDYIVVEKVDSRSEPANSELTVKPSGGGYLAEGAYEVVSQLQVVSSSPDNPRYQGANFHLSAEERTKVRPFSDDFMSLEYRAGPEHTFPETGVGGGSTPGLIRLKTINSSLELNGTTYHDVELFFDPATPKEGNFSFSISNSYVYKEGEFLAQADENIRDSLGLVSLREMSVLAGTLEDNTGNYHLIYSGVNLQGHRLVRNRMRIPDRPGHSSEFVLQPNSSYIFAGSLRSAVYADPERASHYKLQTALRVPE